MLREFQDEILKLKAQLESQNRAAAGGINWMDSCSFVSTTFPELIRIDDFYAGAKVLHGNMMDAESSEESTESEEEKSGKHPCYTLLVSLTVECMWIYYGNICTISRRALIGVRFVKLPAEEELAEPEPIEVIKKIAGVDEKDIAHSAAMHEAERKILERKACTLITP